MEFPQGDGEHILRWEYTVVSEHRKVLEGLSQWVQKLWGQNLLPATSGNFSYRFPEDPSRCYITRSGIDKEYINSDDFLVWDIERKDLRDRSLLPRGVKESDETLIHHMVYKNTSAQFIAHIHLMEALVVLKDFNPLRDNFYSMEGEELLKVIEGVSPDHLKIELAVLENSQDMAKLSELVAPLVGIRNTGKTLVLKNHGMYIWANDFKALKKAVEGYQYLFRYQYQCKLFGGN